MSDSSYPPITIYTDGGADPNPGPGGWAAVLLVPRPGGKGEVRELSGHEPRTTNNRMELTAAIHALESLPGPSRVDLFTDSAYLRKGVSEWLPGWIARGWRRQTGELQNEDLWRRLAAAAAGHQVTWHWVKGHAGNRWNERADRLATTAIRRQREQLAAANAANRARDGGSTAGPEEAGGLPGSGAPDVEVYLRVAYPAGGPGGWAALLRRGVSPTAEEVLTGTAAVPSANALDLVAAIAALERIPAGLRVAIHSGSDYLRNGAREWLAAWKRGGWKTREGSPVKNRELWQRLDALLTSRRVDWPEIDPAAQAELDRLAPLARAAVRAPRPG